MAETLLKETSNIEEMYLKAVSEPNDNYQKRGYIKCPECGDEILMIPTLKTMNQAIENHVKIHKELLKNNPLERQKTAIQIRLDLAQQVLKQASRPDLC
jgi:DNA-directed RNA polymerase subunit RPC12/RpoP